MGTRDFYKDDGKRKDIKTGNTPIITVIMKYTAKEETSFMKDHFNDKLPD